MHLLGLLKAVSMNQAGWVSLDNNDRQILDTELTCSSNFQFFLQHIKKIIRTGPRENIFPSCCFQKQLNRFSPTLIFWGAVWNFPFFFKNNQRHE